jgi:hypothetical protein
MMQENEPRKRPVGVTVIAIFFIITGIVDLLAGFFSIWISFMCIPSFIIAQGILTERRWVWTVTIVWMLIEIALNTFNIFLVGINGNIISLAVSLTIYCYLYDPIVKTYFYKVDKHSYY